MGGIGLDAQVIAGADREAKKKLGKMAYFVSAAKNLRRRRERVEITWMAGGPCAGSPRP